VSAIEKYVPEDSEIDRMYRVAKAYSDSGFFADAKSAVEAFVKISAGAEMGLQPFVSMSGIAVIKGKPVVGAGILAGLLDSHPDFDYAVTWEPNSTEATSCTVTVYKNGKERGQSTFSLEDARKAGLSGKEVWKAYSRNMLYARAMSNAVAWYAPSVTRSNGRVFVEGELDDDIVPARPAPRPIASARTQMASADTAPADTPEIVVDAELEESAPEPPRPAEDAVGPAPKQADSPSDPTSVLADLLKQMKPEHRRIVKSRTTLIGVKWDKETPAALVKHFGDDHDALMAHLSEPEVQVDVQPEGSEPTADTPEEFQQWVDQQVADEKQRQTQLAKAGAYGK
jgi:hypothetical protein